jgi:hypothetical protein
MADYTITVTVTDEQQAIMDDSVLSWKDWVDTAVPGVVTHKVRQCVNRLIKRDEKLLTGDSVPSDLTKRALAIIDADGYKNRAQREPQD